MLGLPWAGKRGSVGGVGACCTPIEGEGELRSLRDGDRCTLGDDILLREEDSMSILRDDVWLMMFEYCCAM